MKAMVKLGLAYAELERISKNLHGDKLQDLKTE
jgi:hypothetical protein